MTTQSDPRDAASDEPAALISFLALKWDLLRERLNDLERRHAQLEQQSAKQLTAMELRNDRLTEEMARLQEETDRLLSAHAVAVWRWHRLSSRRAVRWALREPSPTLTSDDLADALAHLTLLDPAEYRERVPTASSAPEEHFVQKGWRDGLSPGPAFRPEDYAAANPDVAAAGLNALEHYLRIGWTELRAGVGPIRLRPWAS